MANPQVLSDEQIEQLAREHAGDPSCSSPWGNTFEFEPSELRSFTRAIESATLEALAKQEPFGYCKATPFGWTDCASTDEGAVALYERP